MFEIILLITIVILFLIKDILALDQTKNYKSCKNCKWFINGINNEINNGLCRLFTVNLNGKPIYNLSSHCRDNEFLCGTNGWFYDEILTDSKKEYVNLLSDKEIEHIESNTKEIFFSDNKNFFNTLSPNEINQIENDLTELKNNKLNKEKEAYQHYVDNVIKSNKKNKKYKSEKDLYKLFKKK